VKGVTRVGIFAKHCIRTGEELCYNYNLEWNGFARVRYVVLFSSWLLVVVVVDFSTFALCRLSTCLEYG
jgi:hypothetical protein